MNVSQLHELVRLELLRRIERGALNASLLTRKTGLKQPHISNFLHGKRRLSIPSLDLVLAALGMSVTEFSPASTTAALSPLTIPLVSDEVAMDRDIIPAAAIQEQIPLPRLLAEHLQALPALRSRRGDRFLALAITEEQAAPMHPVLRGGSIVAIDRHAPLPLARPSSRGRIYAIRHRGRVEYGYVVYDRSMLILRPHGIDTALLTIPVEPPAVPAEFMVGRVFSLHAPC